MEEGEAPGALGDAELKAEVKARAAEVDGLLRRNSNKEALRKALENPPISTKTKEIKDANAETVKAVLDRITDTTIDSALEGLDNDSCDVLMKYVYRLLGQNWNSTSLLKWHEKIVSKAGLGTVVRALADRKTV